MKYEVTYSCGHVGTVQIYGTAPADSQVMRRRMA